VRGAASREAEEAGRAVSDRASSDGTRRISRHFDAAEVCGLQGIDPISDFRADVERMRRHSDHLLAKSLGEVFAPSLRRSRDKHVTRVHILIPCAWRLSQN
jgi:hypothetical protein